jgi:hypothetical protein
VLIVELRINESLLHVYSATNARAGDDCAYRICQFFTEQIDIVAPALCCASRRQALLSSAP